MKKESTRATHEFIIKLTLISRRADRAQFDIGGGGKATAMRYRGAAAVRGGHLCYTGGGARADEKVRSLSARASSRRRHAASAGVDGPEEAAGPGSPLPGTVESTWVVRGNWFGNK